MKSSHSSSDPDLSSFSAMEELVTRHLSQPPAVVVPPDFAARVAEAVASGPRPSARRWLGWGPRLALASGALLMLAMFVLAPHTTASLSNVPFDAELVLMAELSGLALFARRLLQD